MFWLFRFRGERWIDTWALWINAIVWQLQKFFYKISHWGGTSADFAQSLSHRHPKRHWLYFPFDLTNRYFYDSKLKKWIEPTGIMYYYLAPHLVNPAPSPDDIQPNQIGLDIGAYRGYWSILYGDKVLPNGLIFAFEPDPNNYKHLVRILSKNNYSRIIPLRLAVWRESTSLTLERTLSHEYDCSVSRVKEGPSGNVLSVSLDSLVEALALPRLDWIKMDIEGAEVEALKGAKNTLKRYKPKLWIETHNSLEKVKALLAEFEYVIKKEKHVPSENGHIIIDYVWAEPILSSTQ